MLARILLFALLVSVRIHICISLARSDVIFVFVHKLRHYRQGMAARGATILQKWTAQQDVECWAVF
jgi:hypothetical protein